MNLNQKLSKFPSQFTVTIIVVALALLFTIYFILSGQMNQEQSLSQLKVSDPEVKNVQVTNQKEGAKLFTISCENGSSYDVYIPADSDFSALKNSYCNN